MMAGLPAVATRVGGQEEIEGSGLTLLDVTATPAEFAFHIISQPVRQAEVAPQFSGARWPRLYPLLYPAHQPVQRQPGVLFVTANLNAGGAQRSLVNLATELSRRGQRCEVAVGTDSTHPYFYRQLVDAGIPVFRTAEHRDVVEHAMSLLPWARSMGTLCFWNADAKLKTLLAKFTSPGEVRIVDAIPGASAYREMDETADWQKAIAYSSEQWYPRLRPMVSKCNAAVPAAVPQHRVIPNGVPFAQPSTRNGPIRKLLVQGRITPSKKLDVLIEGFLRASDCDSSLELDVFGQAEPRYQSYLDTLLNRTRGFSTRIHFHGAAPDLQGRIADYDLAIVLGEGQGCPNTVLEAQARGVCVIANASGGTVDLVIDQVTGYLLPEHCSSHDVATAIVAAVRHPDLARQFGATALTRVRRDYSMALMADRWTEVLFPTCGD